MTYHPSALEGHIPGSLVPPETVAKKSKDMDNVPTPDPLSVPEEELLPELQESITVKIKSIARGQEQGTLVEGAPAQIYVKTAQDVDGQEVADLTRMFTKNPVKDAMTQLEDKLRDMVGKDAAKKANLKIAADGELRQQYVMAVYDTCKKAGFEKIHFVPPPVLNTKIK
jgi:biopolymer transport protein ExbD